MSPFEPTNPRFLAAGRAIEYEIELNRLSQELAQLPELMDLSPEDQAEAERKYKRLGEVERLLADAHIGIARDLVETFERIRRDGREQLALERRSQFRLVSTQN
ncbi:hypothetical protein [Agrobacterium sp. NPDC090283]|uniref:hypothetical protein n=1 Tax=Agrobacterium sp. NPDC090283 TaxID=3363920 RepID=UPI003839ED9C